MNTNLKTLLLAVSGFALPCSAATLFTAGLSAQQTSIVLPKAFATKMGGSANSIPHATHQSRAQQVFLGSEIGGGFTITQLCLREDQYTTSSRSQTQILEVLLGRTLRTETTLSTTFAANYSAPPTTVYRGFVRVPKSNGSGTPTSFNLCINFTTPYTHRGSMKNLLGDNPDAKLVKSLSSELAVTPETPPILDAPEDGAADDPDDADADSEEEEE